MKVICGDETLKVTKREIQEFARFYPVTVTAMGGVEGFTQWLGANDMMPAQAAGVFRAEGDRLCRDFGEGLSGPGEPCSKFEAVAWSNVMNVVCRSLP
jgi:hypothetical protein